MSTATLNLRVLSKRMMTREEAAHHCGRSAKQFERECPVVPVAFANGDRRYDVRDLDTWIDTLKGDVHAAGADAILAKLG